MKRYLVTAALLALAVPTAHAVPPPGKGKPDAPSSASSSTSTPTAAQLCKQQRKVIGMALFRQTYAPTGSPKAAMDACLENQVQLLSTAAKNAAMECKEERTDPGFAAGHDNKSFSDHYGTNPNKKNAFGKCVSTKRQEAVAEGQSATMNAAKKCKAERADPAFAAGHDNKSFSDYYGTNPNKKNAFGKCVSKLAKQQGSSS